MKSIYGLLTPVQYSHSKSNKKSDEYWLFECACGNQKISRLYDVQNNKINSCGCLRKKILAERNKSSAKHGMYNSLTYKSWACIIERCYNPNSSNFQNYGEKGIIMCERWRDSFENFLEDMGEKPDGFTIDRIDVNGNYEPLNCRWANAKTQANNRTNNRKISYNGEIHTLAEWSDIVGIKPSTISKRIDKYGWSIEEALTRKPK